MYTGLCNPFTMFISDGNWCSVNYLELWNKGNTVYTLNNNTIHKTIYDPLPYNYNMARSAAFSNFTTRVSFNKGNYFYTGIGSNTIFIPSVGDRTWRTGNVQEYNDTGDYLTAGPANEGCSIFLYSPSGNPNYYQVDYKAFAFTILGDKQ